MRMQHDTWRRRLYISMNVMLALFAGKASLTPDSCTCLAGSICPT